MTERVLGTVYEGRDQGRSMILASSAWFLYIVWVSIADASWSSSMVSALTRFASLWFFVSACLIFLGAMPRYLRVPTRLTVVIALIGAVVQLSGVLKLFQRVPNFGEFEATFYIAQLIYALAVFPFAYCLKNHPLFPKWLALALTLDAVFWIAYYWASVNNFAYLIFEILAWGPSLIIEVLTGFYFVRAGLRLSRMAEPESPSLLKGLSGSGVATY
ncbi:hypothetical protein CKALI_04270 [Corynebacterium kalinowskii]|uniref:DUF4386 domain-containing protein n=1 Tax=Corynebacterium kalinowskii TaxID=2675216 RepID=A0A6B8VC53_9CORY|nr:hypothetical protein [Corynebacterium kalinowskii]QGU01733.1 hypothetical protein CKALI_04270 [Corynebacterium kalinowskii]